VKIVFRDIEYDSYIRSANHFSQAMAATSVQFT